MMNSELTREIDGLNGDRRMTQLAVESAKNDMREKLLGDMGQDMKAVLNGERKVEAEFGQRQKWKIKAWFRRLLRRF